ncbi:molecular chaperone DnaJ [Escherichia coli]|nr:molecular chaperone DnaJ [Escherichia coli]EEW0124437.1 molecular chaperone DnaJ [Escherichia coli]EEZ4734509.1 molecular chaperone DnaJ [Escherichia coli]EFA5834270.1 molecular chaperone DnaJ [Escherichia coli]EFA8071423.1 molecular chaperone DnaJ [Escherichia coli]
MTTITKEQLISHARESVSYLEDLKLRASKEGEDCKVVLEMVERELELVRIALASMEAEPVSQTYNLPELIEGMEVSIDVSTCDADLGNRYFGTVTEALELDTAKNGYILLVQDAEPNFDVNGNSPVTPDGWVIVPKKLTAENGAKGVLSGEFSETTFISCPECFGDDDCETCDGSGRIEIKVPVSWTTIKTIWAKGCEYFSIVAPQQDG